jgi:hypothetical protein
MIHGYAFKIKYFTLTFYRLLVAMTAASSGLELRLLMSEEDIMDSTQAAAGSGNS